MIETSRSIVPDVDDDLVWIKEVCYQKYAGLLIGVRQVDVGCEMWASGVGGGRGMVVMNEGCWLALCGGPHSRWTHEWAPTNAPIDTRCAAPRPAPPPSPLRPLARPSHPHPPPPTHYAPHSMGPEHGGVLRTTNCPTPASNSPQYADLPSDPLCYEPVSIHSPIKTTLGSTTIDW